jgi:thioredoxin
MEITQEQLKEKINNGEKVIVDFWAEWCSPCKVMKPIFEKVSNEMVSRNSDIQMYTLNVMENQDLAVDLGIRSIPTVKAFSEGKEIYSSVGMLNESEINKITETII